MFLSSLYFSFYNYGKYTIIAEEGKSIRMKEGINRKIWGNTQENGEERNWSLEKTTPVKRRRDVSAPVPQPSTSVIFQQHATIYPTATSETGLLSTCTHSFPFPWRNTLLPLLILSSANVALCLILFLPNSHYKCK